MTEEKSYARGARVRALRNFDIGVKKAIELFLRARCAKCWERML